VASAEIIARVSATTVEIVRRIARTRSYNHNIN
jgi:hypothetical protein